MSTCHFTGDGENQKFPMVNKSHCTIYHLKFIAERTIFKIFF